MGNPFNDVLGILKLDENSINNAAQGSFGNPMIVLAVVSVIYGLGSLLWMPGSFILSIIGTFIGLFIGSFIGVGLIWIFAKIFGGQGAYMAQYKPSTDVMILYVLSLIPFIGGLVYGIWSIIADVKIVMVVHKLSTGKAIAAVLLPVVLVTVIVVILLIVAAAAFFSILDPSTMLPA